MSCLFSQQSSSVSIENTNQTDTAGSNLMESLHHHSSPDDIVAMMTSNALEDETDPLFLSYASQVSTTEAPAMKNDIGSNQIIELSTDESSLHGSTPNNEPLREPSKINKNTLEPHIYHFNKMLIDTVYNIICTLYPTPKADAASTTGPVHADQISQKCFARFYVLETVARVPYFAYLSVLHLRETLGERVYSSSPTLGDASDMNNSRLRTHYAEADNELHHLLIMESLGGNTNPVDRAIAQCMAMGYYWYVVLVYTTISPQAAYHLSELIEDHAYHTYDDFLNMYEKELKQLPVPPIAKQYYMDDNSYLQDLCRTVRDTATTTFKDPANGISHPKPILNSLYDVFVCVRDDEKEHWKTLCHLVQYDHMTAVTTTVDNVTTTVPVQSTEPATTMTTFPWQILKYP
jgi:ubiquinol oxidase